jgi:hypothetical protein
MPEIKLTRQLSGSGTGAATVNVLLNMRITRNFTMTAAVGAATTAAHFYLANTTDRFTGSGDGVAYTPRTIRMTNLQSANDSDFVPGDEF